MTKEELKQTKKELQLLEYTINLYNQQPIIQEYNALIQKYQQLVSSLDIDCTLSSVEELKTNEIYVYIGTYEVNANGVKKVNRINPSATFIKYRNLELNPEDDHYEIEVPYGMTSLFEKEKTVCYPPYGSSDDYYNQLKLEYFTSKTKNEEDALGFIEEKRCHR